MNQVHLKFQYRRNGKDVFYTSQLFAVSETSIMRFPPGEIELEVVRLDCPRDAELEQLEERMDELRRQNHKMDGQLRDPISLLMLAKKLLKDRAKYSPRAVKHVAQALSAITTASEHVDSDVQEVTDYESGAGAYKISKKHWRDEL